MMRLVETLGEEIVLVLGSDEDSTWMDARFGVREGQLLMPHGLAVHCASTGGFVAGNPLVKVLTEESGAASKTTRWHSR